MKQIPTIILFSYLLLILFTHTASAHIGGGPPFLQINGKYAQTNPFFSNDPNINIPQDTNPVTQPLIVNQPIEFTVDTTQLLVPSDIANNSTYRWTLIEGSTEYKFGKAITYTYHTPKSYLITLDVKAPGETDYTTIDTTQVNILPTPRYHVPYVSIALETNKRKSNKPILFKGEYILDSSAKAKTTIWTFGDNQISHTPVSFHSYQNITNYSTFPVLFRVIDTNNFITDAGVIIQSVDNKLLFIDANGKENTISVSDSIKAPLHSSKKTSGSSLIVYLIFGIIGIVILLIGFTTLKRKVIFT